MRRSRPAVVLVLLACGCEPAPPGPAVQRPAAALLAEVEALTARHLVPEALALIERERGRWPPAAGPSSRALAGDEARLRLRQASLLVTVARPREAAAMLEALDRFQPLDVAHRGLLAEACLDAGDATRALAALRDDRSPRARLLRGRTLSLLGRHDEARLELAALLVGDPWHDEAQLELGRELVAAGRTGAGQALLDGYRTGAPRRAAEQEALGLEAAGDLAGAHHRRAQAERQRGRLFESMMLSNQALATNPGLGAAYLDLARLSLLLERPGDAIGPLEKLPPAPQVTELLERARATATGAAPAAGDSDTAPLREAMRGVPISRCVPALVQLAAVKEAAGAHDEARHIALFASRLEPGDAAARRLAARLHAAPAERFVRLWALAPLDDADSAARFAAELAPVGLDAAAVRAVLGK